MAPALTSQTSLVLYVKGPPHRLSMQAAELAGHVNRVNPIASIKIQDIAQLPERITWLTHVPSLAVLNRAGGTLDVLEGCHAENFMGDVMATGSDSMEKRIGAPTPQDGPLV